MSKDKLEKVPWTKHEWEYILYNNSVCKKCGIVWHHKGIYWAEDAFDFTLNLKKNGWGLRLGDKELR